jgi:hypothetical protein
VRPEYLLVVGAGMGSAYALRKWHFRKERVTHQAWQPYLVFRLKGFNRKRKKRHNPDEQKDKGEKGTAMPRRKETKGVI